MEFFDSLLTENELTHVCVMKGRHLFRCMNCRLLLLKCVRKKNQFVNMNLLSQKSSHFCTGLVRFGSGTQVLFNAFWAPVVLVE